MTIDPAHLRDLAKRYTAPWCSQDPEGVAAFFAPNGLLSVNGVPAVGRSAITEVARGFMTAFPDMILTMEDLAVSGDGHFLPLDIRWHQHSARRDWEVGSYRRIRGMDVWRGRFNFRVRGPFRRG